MRKNHQLKSYIVVQFFCKWGGKKDGVCGGGAESSEKLIFFPHADIRK